MTWGITIICAVFKSRSRFIVAGDQVHDTRSGMIWMKDAGISEFPLSWAEAFEFIEQMNRNEQFGHTDWKLPNRRELMSLISYDSINPALPEGHPFKNVFNGYYWTSTTCRRLPDQAWYIHLGGARVFKGMKHGSYMVWPVRSAGPARIFQTGQTSCYDAAGQKMACDHSGQDGQFQTGICWPSPRFTGDGYTAVDRLTGLAWSKDADLTRKPVDWQTAVRKIEAMNRDARYGHADWRLPHIRELESLVDLNADSPALPAGAPFANVRQFYWSATTSRYDRTYAWALYTIDGIIGVGYKTNPEFFVWPVRGPDRIGHAE